MSYTTQRNVGQTIRPVKAIKVQSSAAATINGPSIDRLGFHSAVIEHICGDATGSPSAQSVASKLQHSDATGSGFADVSPAVAPAALTANDTEAEVNVDLSGLKRYIRVVTTVSFTAGTSPAIPVAAVVVLGGAESTPQ
jgi:hypothetical protein